MAHMMGCLRSIFGSGTLGLFALWCASCNSTLVCPDGKYAPGSNGCEKSAFAIQAAFSIPMPAQGRLDLRDNPADGLSITVQAQSADFKSTYKLAQAPHVDLTLNDAVKTDVPIVGYGENHVTVSRVPDPLEVGLLSAQVSLPGLDPVPTATPLRIYRSPLFGAPETVLEIFNQKHAIPIRARVSVQIVNSLGGPGRVLVSEETQCPSWWPDMTKCGGAPYYRWLDLYSPASIGMDSLDYANDSTWQAWYGMMQASTSSLLAYGKGAVIRYDPTRVPNPLSLWPQAGVMQDIFNTAVPKDATALSACAEESALLLARPGEVLVFGFDSSATVTPLGVVKTQGGSSAVIAARDVLGPTRDPRSAAYFAIVFESGGRGTLLKLGLPGAMLQTELVAGPAAFGAVGAAALADLDSDGLQDLVVAKADDGALMWSPQLQGGVFAEASELKSGAASGAQTPIKVPGATSISIGDLNNDGLPDLAVATADKHLYIYRNQR